MTVKDLTIQTLRLENEGLREELQQIVQALQICRFCKYIHTDCTPGSRFCVPEWRGLKNERKVKEKTEP